MSTAKHRNPGTEVPDDEADGRVRPDDAAPTDRLDVLRRVSGSYTGLYGADYHDDLRAEWPE